MVFMLELPTIENKIKKILEKADRPLSKTEIAHRIKVSPATVSKYVDVMFAEGKIIIKKYGNIHLVQIGE